MKRAWQLIVLALAAALPAAAQNATSNSAGDLRGGKQAVRRPEGAESKPWLRFVQLPKGAPVRDLGAGQGALDLGSVSYLGGAVASQLRIEAPLFSNVLFPVYVGLLIWGGLYLREDRLHALIPLRTR